VVLTDNLPAFTSFSSFTAGPAGTVSGSQITWNLGTLTPGVYTFSFNVVVSNSAPNGSGLSNSASVNFLGASSAQSANSNTVTVVVLTPTFTPTSIFTNTPTPVSKTVFRGPFPNPSNGGPVFVDVDVPELSTVRWSVFTLAFRKIVSGEISVNTTGVVRWDLTDKQSAKVADGLYYLRLEVIGMQTEVKVFKVLIIR